VIDTVEGLIEPQDRHFLPGEMFHLQARSLFMFSAQAA
jgi:hypothetical protein